MDLFKHSATRDRRGQPLAERMRPTSLDEYVGQEHLLGEGKLLTRALGGTRLPSLILWGPPGTGKTTLARILARQMKADFTQMSAVQSGVKEIREVAKRAEERRDEFGHGTILFIDEIHRFSKSQQDALLPHVENGTLVLIGATTENPSFEVNAPLLSRARVLRLDPLSEDALATLVRRAVEREMKDVELPEASLKILVARAEGDARRALNALELAASISDEGVVTEQVLEQALQSKTLLYDKAGEEHYNIVSAFIKSLRGSDADAAVYWMARMLEAGEDPRFVLRRLVIFASEDIGNADPMALTVVIAAHRAYEFMGMPEGVLPMTQAALYLARAPKSNEALTAYAKARRLIAEHGALPVPDKLRNASTKLMKQMGYGRGYKYPHDFEGNYVEGESYLPDELAGDQPAHPERRPREARPKSKD